MKNAARARRRMTATRGVSPQAPATSPSTVTENPKEIGWRPPLRHRREADTGDAPPTRAAARHISTTEQLHNQ